MNRDMDGIYLYFTTAVLLLVPLRTASTEGRDLVLTTNDIGSVRIDNPDETQKTTSLVYSPALHDDKQERKSIRFERNVSATSKQMSERLLGVRTKRKARIGRRYRWPKAIVPYEIGKGFSTKDLKTLKDAMDEFSRHTCIKFRKALPNDKDKIVFKNDEGCGSYVGRIGGAQIVELHKLCRNMRHVLHELGHAIGFYHEQSRPDRHKYVKIHKENIFYWDHHNFEQYSKADVNTYGIPYDHRSLMHYAHKDATKNDKSTITAINTWLTKRLGTAKRLRFGDIKLANLMYSCARLNNCGKIKCNGVAFLGSDCNCKCPNPTGDENNPTIDCPPKMDFKIRKGWHLQNPWQNRNIGVVCASPRCADYRLSRKDRRKMPTITYKTTVTSIPYYGGNAALEDKILYFTIQPIRCRDSGIYICSCQPRKGGPRVSATWHMRVKGCR